MLNVSGQTAYQMYTWPEEDLQAHFAFLRRFNQKLVESGELVGIEALTSPDQAKWVRAGKDGRPVTDGVFPETKEFLAGFWTVDVESPSGHASSPRRRPQRRVRAASPST